MTLERLPPHPRLHRGAGGGGDDHVEDDLRLVVLISAVYLPHHYILVKPKDGYPWWTKRGFETLRTRVLFPPVMVTRSLIHEQEGSFHFFAVLTKSVIHTAGA